MSELDVFETKVNNNIKLLSSPDARTRRKAAAWLGEAGDPSAIIELRKLYERDPNYKVRRTAGESLGMMRALEQGLAGDDNEVVYDLLEDVQLRNKLGKRTSIPLPVLSRIILGLLTSLIVLLVFNFVIWPQIRPPLDTGASSSMSSAPVDAAAAKADLMAMSANFRADATGLQAAYQDAANLNCDLILNNPTPYTADLSGMDPALADIAARLNGQVLELVTARAPYVTACAGGTTLTEDQVAAPLATLGTPSGGAGQRGHGPRRSGVSSHKTTNWAWHACPYNSAFEDAAQKIPSPSAERGFVFLRSKLA